MKTRTFLTSAFLIVLLFYSTPSRAGTLLDSQMGDGLSSFYSFVSPGGTGNYEAADDIDVIGNIDRVVVTGYMFNFPYQNFQGVYVRFYEYGAENAPGALQAEYFLPAGGSGLAYEPSFAAWFDITLPTPFVANGRYFLSVQIKADSWNWDSAAFRHAPMYTRTSGGTWQSLSHGLTYGVYGTVIGPGRIDSLSPTTATRSGYLEIFGANFSGDGQVLIDGLSAPVASWAPDRIVAYVPEAARVGTVSVQVVTTGGTSNPASLNVTDRAPNGHVNWRLRMEGPYSAVRPARGPDGTIYAIDVYSRLYAVSPDGALQWVARNAGNKGVAVGSDGTIYTGSEADVKAFNPDGTLKWTFVQNPRAFILIGLSVGPDGNIYGVASNGMGVFSLTPEGTLRWTNPEAYSRLIVDYAEIVFGPNNGRDQLYFYANNHTRAVRLDDGGSVFTISPTGQPAVSPLDGTMHAKASAYSPSGQLLWQFTFPVSGVPVSDPDMGSDGTHYVVNRSFELYALNPNGTEKWNVTLPNYVGAPNVDPANSLLVLGSNNTLNNPGFIQAISTTSRKELWRVDLSAEETSVYNPWTGQYGFNQYVDTRARFSADGQTVYLITAIATGGLVTDRCFLYAISTGSTQTPPPTSTLLHSSSISLSARTTRTVVKVNGNVTVVDENNAAVPGATVYATWTLPGGSTQNQTATTDTKGVAKFSTSGGSGTYTLTITGITKTGYTFDPSNSVLSKSITK